MQARPYQSLANCRRSHLHGISHVKTTAVGHTARPRHWPISTLKPELLSPSDHLNISDAYCVSLFFQYSRSTKSERMYYRREVGCLPGTFAPFPEEARGFFYCAPVRFRCTPSSSPSSFAAGHDLLLPNGLPWQLLVGQAAIAYPTLRAALLKEQFLTPKSLAEWHERLGKTEGQMTLTLMMFGLRQQFPVNFARGLFLHVVPPETAPQRVAAIQLNHIFVSQPGKKRFHPFVGQGLAQFEVSPNDPNILHLRIVKLLEPASRAVPEAVVGGIPPREGQLFHHRFKREGDAGRPWSFDLRGQNKNALALRMLVGREGQFDLQIHANDASILGSNDTSLHIQI
ncbi:hypothetical protein FB45DRAFT_944371 [Roridomyces roridus]|uniref:Uncharacterized protein n=1 Tax=Roridomyces roridus TaxID=1738132 RepID=A0AAD7B465_9AGAR|nr:hypothetical protein FB45DRAFT_944371 [Roridomyces roridus]